MGQDRIRLAMALPLRLRARCDAGALESAPWTREATLKHTDTEPPRQEALRLGKRPWRELKYRSFRTPGFPELRVSARLPLGHPVTAHAASPAKMADGGLCEDLNPARLFASAVARVLLQVKLLSARHCLLAALLYPAITPPRLTVPRN